MFRWFNRDLNLEKRFIWHVLVPPFLALLILAGLGFWQLDKLIRSQAINQLERSASSLSTKLEREFSIRETILKRTGEELFVNKSKYQADVQKLESDRAACRTHVAQKSSFSGSPNNACDAFSSNQSAVKPTVSSVESGYVLLGEKLSASHQAATNDRLSAYKQFFPETLAIIVLDKDQKIVSSALSGAFKGDSNKFIDDAKLALTQSINGKIIVHENFELAIFAQPISDGSVLVAYDINNQNFIRQAWAATPIDKTQSLAVVLDNDGNPIYPDLKDANAFKPFNTPLRQKPYADIKLEGIENMAVAEEVVGSGWLVVVASPRAAVLAPLRDAQLAAVIFVGILIICFLWIGTYFIRQIVGTVMHLVTGALVFGSGRLDYRIKLEKSGRELNQLAQTLNNMAARIEADELLIDQKNKEFISIATHELRAPMTAIIGYLSMFKERQKHKLDKASQNLIDEVYYGTARLKDLVNDMLDVARLEGGRAEFNFKAVSIDKVVDDVVKTMSVVAKMSKVKIIYDSNNAKNVLADDARLKIIINNLVSNAIKYNREHGTVSITHQTKSDDLITMVKDTGLGIPEEQKEHIFEKFFRVQHSDRSKITGTGLGMFITSRYVEEMGGKIWFESAHGKGTTFYFSLPLAKKGMHIEKKIAEAPKNSRWIMRWRKKMK